MPALIFGEFMQLQGGCARKVNTSDMKDSQKSERSSWLEVARGGFTF
jgi:hypothetical protein